MCNSLRASRAWTIDTNSESCHSFCNKVKVIKTVISIILATFNPLNVFSYDWMAHCIASNMRSDALSNFVNSKWLTKLFSCHHLLSDGYSELVEGITSYCYVMSSAGQCHAIWQIIITSPQLSQERDPVTIAYYHGLIDQLIVYSGADCG